MRGSLPPGGSTVAAKGRGLHEVRTRVMCHLPVNNGREVKAFLKVLSYLQGAGSSRRQAAKPVPGWK